MIAVVPQELLIEKLRQDALLGQTLLNIGKGDFDLLSDSLPELRLSLLSKLLLDDILCPVERFNEFLSDELVEIFASVLLWQGMLDKLQLVLSHALLVHHHELEHLQFEFIDTSKNLLLFINGVHLLTLT